MLFIIHVRPPEHITNNLDYDALAEYILTETKKYIDDKTVLAEGWTIRLHPGPAEG